jgi:hypothetical protein
MRSFESIAKTDHCDILSGNQRKESWGLAEQLLSFLFETRNVHTYFGQYHTLRDIREQLTEEDLVGTRGFIKYAIPVFA